MSELIEFVHFPSHAPDQQLIRQWLIHTAEKHHAKIVRLTYLFASDEEMLEANRKYLQHDYLTDIITFPITRNRQLLESDIILHLPTIEANAATYASTPSEELLRVLVHAVLHLVGFDDQNEADQSDMRLAEEEALAAWRQQFATKA